MPGSTTSHDDDSLGVEELLAMVGNGAEHYAHLCLRLAGCIVAIGHHTGFHGATHYTATHTVAQTFWLFEDFLQHEVRETALLYLTEIDIHSLNLRV